MTATMKHLIVAVVPAYNEEESIARVVEDLLGYGVVPLVIDDGSTDKTFVRAKAAGAVVKKHIINIGQGAALMTGIKLALDREADIIVTFDADGQLQAREIQKLIKPIERGEAEIVLGSRFPKSRNMPLVRFIIIKIATLYTRFTTGLRITDTHNGLRAMTRRMAEKLKLEQPRMAHASEILHQVARHKWRYQEVPVEVIYSDYSMRKGQSGWSGFRILFDLWFK